MNRLIITACVLGTAGCTVLGPDYVAPAFKSAPAFVGGTQVPLQNAAAERWWLAFSDPVLNALVEDGLAQNLSIEAALARIDAARANSERFGVASQISGDATLAGSVSETDGVRSEDASARVGAAFVFDLFGETARRKEQAGAQLEASEFDAGTARLAYLSELVSTYIRLRYFQAAQGVTRQTISSRETALRIARERRDLGSTTQLDVARASSLAAAARASLPPLQAEERIAAFRIATLINQPGDTVLARIAQMRKIPGPTTDADSGLPVDLLRNRPDLRALERRLAAATAAIGIREAELYPSLRLNGTVTAASTNAWSFGPSIVLPLLNRSGLRANQVIAVAEAREAELVYRGAFLAAIEEIQVALVQTRMRQRQVAELISATSSAQAANSLAIQSFEAGAVALDAVLDTEQTRLSNSLDLVFSQSELAQAWVRQQIAAGKGWVNTPQGAGDALLSDSAEGS